MPDLVLGGLIFMRIVTSVNMHWFQKHFSPSNSKIWLGHKWSVNRSLGNNILQPFHHKGLWLEILIVLETFWDIFKKKVTAKLGYNEQLTTSYNRFNLCSKMTNWPLKFVRFDRVFVNNRVSYKRVSLYFFNKPVLGLIKFFFLYRYFFELWVI